jgi:hypothetical protein
LQNKHLLKQEKGSDEPSNHEESRPNNNYFVQLNKFRAR